MLLKEVFDTVELAWSLLGKEIKVCELGNQKMKWHPEYTAKKFFLSEGAKEHISIDMNGKDGALRLNLAEDLLATHPEWKGRFDLVTNYGTAEHVENGIYECYKNIHNFCREGGILINDGPPSTCCPWHSPYHYKPNFFVELAQRCGYKILLMDSRVVIGRKRQQRPEDRTLVIAMFQKPTDAPFISKESFYEIDGIQGIEK